MAPKRDKEKLPSTVRILGVDWDVVTPQKSLEDKNLIGHMMYSKCRIEVDPSLPLGRKREVFLHELTHAVNACLLTDKLQLNEEQINAFATGFFAVLADNPETLGFIGGIEMTAE